NLKMSNETFLIPIIQNNDLSDIALNELRIDLDEHALHQRYDTDIAYLAGNSRKYSLNSVQTDSSPVICKKILFFCFCYTFVYFCFYRFCLKLCLLSLVVCLR